MKTLSFLSFHINHKIAKGISLQRINLHPEKEEYLHALIVPANDPAPLHKTPHLGKIAKERDKSPKNQSTPRERRIFTLQLSPPTTPACSVKHHTSEEDYTIKNERT
eukprot:TRINITY_DN10107_c0_g1_i4.p1 TRINITY_DN10107_c0_g1~~TRINITY_DN10107_c0_g1_i4.p1  ORF type:complete len:107 (+),score=1.75 TRINITY_DN10107_c0_g1_i4:349-669(+)